MRSRRDPYLLNKLSHPRFRRSVRYLEPQSSFLEERIERCLCDGLVNLRLSAAGRNAT
jgi:hypothetical protein